MGDAKKPLAHPVGRDVAAGADGGRAGGAGLGLVEVDCERGCQQQSTWMRERERERERQRKREKERLDGSKTYRAGG